MDEIWNAFVAAVVSHMPTLVASVVGLIVAGIAALRAKAKMVKDAAETAALDAEKEMGAGHGEEKKKRAMEAMRKTLGGKLSRQVTLEDALKEHGMAAVDRASKVPSPDPNAN